MCKMGCPSTISIVKTCKESLFNPSAVPVFIPSPLSQPGKAARLLCGIPIKTSKYLPSGVNKEVHLWVNSWENKVVLNNKKMLKTRIFFPFMLDAIYYQGLVSPLFQNLAKLTFGH